ncbi:MAG: NAD(P)H-dependent glycerol-3-phosphate dehydrogenase [Elusimicrobia bacterium]|nr:NAD(P)H-dependent glycerol-3-phosphate dehydrogenase [Elusimicrobiota bacterium]
MLKKNKICVLGGGIWGSVIADILATKQSNEIIVWEFFKEYADAMNKTRIHPNFKELKINKKIKITMSLKEALEKTELCIIAVPSRHVRTIIKHAKPFITDKMIFISLSKGIEANTLMTVAEIIEDELPVLKNRVMAFSGPSFAMEVARKIPTKIILAGRKSQNIKKISEIFNIHPLGIQVSYDRKGVELGGALKNVYAIGGGIVKGLKGTGKNTKAAYLTESLQEIKRIIAKLKGHRDTIVGLSTTGDLILTSTSNMSRNYRFGKKLAEHKKPKKALTEIKTTTEGYNSVLSAKQLCLKNKIKAPIIKTIWRIIYKNAEPETILNSIGLRIRQ